MANVDLHIHHGESNVKDIVNSMYQNNIDIIALSALDSLVYMNIVAQANEVYGDLEPNGFEHNAEGIRINDKYILNAKEHSTKEGFHVLTVGSSVDCASKDTEIEELIDESLKENALIILAHPFVDNGSSRTAGHISEEQRDKLVEICIKYHDNINLEWNGYCNNVARFAAKYAFKIKRQDIQYHDVNKKVEELISEMDSNLYCMSLIPGTDLHVKKKKHLDYIGTSMFTTQIEMKDIDRKTGDKRPKSPSDVFNSLKEKIAYHEFEITKQTVSCYHLFDAYVKPMLINKVKKIIQFLK